jgi:hypothetical protein
VAAAANGQFDVALAFSTKYQPAHPLLEDWIVWQRLKEKYFGYHRDLPPEHVAQRIGGRVVFQKQSEGQWVAVIAVEREENAGLSFTAPEGGVYGERCAASLKRCPDTNQSESANLYPAIK